MLCMSFLGGGRMVEKRHKTQTKKGGTIVIYSLVFIVKKLLIILYDFKWTILNGKTIEDDDDDDGLKWMKIIWWYSKRKCFFFFMIEKWNDIIKSICACNNSQVENFVVLW